jgi:hypothetical protein
VLYFKDVLAYAWPPSPFNKPSASRPKKVAVF